MNGFEQGIIVAGREVGRMGGRMFEGGSHLDSLEIVCLVLGLLLWAAVMTTLVMGMIALVRHLKHPKTSTETAKTSGSAKS